MNKIVLAVGIAVLLLGVGAVVGYTQFKNANSMQEPKEIASYEDCVAAGYPTMRSLPPKCTTPDGKIFTQTETNDTNNAAGTSQMVDDQRIPGPVQMVKELIAQQNGVTVDQVDLLEATEMEWPDACLGLADPDQMCAQMITPGYKIRAESKGKTYTYRTNADGTVIKAEK